MTERARFKEIRQAFADFAAIALFGSLFVVPYGRTWLFLAFAAIAVLSLSKLP